MFNPFVNNYNQPYSLLYTFMSWVHVEPKLHLSSVYLSGFSQWNWNHILDNLCCLYIKCGPWFLKRCTKTQFAKLTADNSFAILLWMVVKSRTTQNMVEPPKKYRDKPTINWGPLLGILEMVIGISLLRSIRTWLSVQVQVHHARQQAAGSTSTPEVQDLNFISCETCRKNYESNMQAGNKNTLLATIKQPKIELLHDIWRLEAHSIRPRLQAASDNSRSSFSQTMQLHARSVSRTATWKQQ